MPRKQYKYHFIYKTTNILNDNFYYGMHSTFSLDDGYIGSGTRLWHSIKKHGKENFKMEIIEFLPNRKLLSEREKDIITNEMLENPKCMNLKHGGFGGFYSVENQRNRSIAGGKAFSERLKKDEDFRKLHAERSSSIMKQNHMNGKIKYNTFTGKKHKPETIEKIKQTMFLNKIGFGEKNSQYGKRWIHNNEKSMSIKKEFVDEYLKNGWLLGRKIK